MLKDVIPKKIKKIVSARDYSDKNVQKFNNKLAITEWQDTILLILKQHIQYFIKKICKVYNESFPLKHLKLNIKLGSHG